MKRASTLIHALNLRQCDTNRVGSMGRPGGQYTNLLFKHRRCDLGCKCKSAVGLTIRDSGSLEGFGLLEYVGIEVEFE